MSSPSRALSRCVVTLSTSVPQHTPEALLGERVDAAAARIEALFDELEAGGRRFVSPEDPHFTPPRVGVAQRGDETCRVEVVCSPSLTSVELSGLAQQVAALLAERLLPLNLPDITPLGLPPVSRPSGADADTDPGEPPSGVAPGAAPTRTHRGPATRRREEVVTRPQGVMAIPPRPSPQVDMDAPDEVTDPQRRDEAATRPEGVMAIPPRKKPR